MAVRPCRPLLREVVIEQIRERLAIVTDYPCVAVDKAVEAVQEIIAPPYTELLGQTGRPVGFIDFVGVVEESMGIRRVAGRERRVDMLKIVGYGQRVEVVDDPSFTTGSGPLHALTGTAHEERDHALAVLVGRLETSYGSQFCVFLFFIGNLEG